jgi:putative two-component system response regulator
VVKVDSRNGGRAVREGSSEDRGDRLLFVDDDPILLNLFARMLEEQPWQAHFCTSVDEALEYLIAHPVDTIISDIRMPERDGFDLLSAIRGREESKQIPVIILTGDSDRALKRRALDLGATDLLNKPIAREDLFARIRSALQLKRYEDRLAEQVRELDRRVNERTRELAASHREVVWRLAKAAEFRDDETGNHVFRVGICSRLLAEGLGCNQDFLELILLTSPLHDIGKLGIPDSVLLKEGRLNPEERKLMERHCIMGAEILSHEPKSNVALSLVEEGLLPPVGNHPLNPFLEMASSIALGHHERWDGLGYPNRLAAGEIPLECRIVAVADVFDALTSWRPYKPPLSDDEAVSMLVKASGRHFDPGVIEVFKARLENLLEVRSQIRDRNDLNGYFNRR